MAARSTRALVCLFVLGFLGIGSALAEETTAPQRVVSLGGSLTEIVYALGAQDRLVGVDLTSQYPEEAGALPQVGYVRTLSAEGVLSLRPDLILATSEAGPPEVITQLQNTGLKIAVIPEQHSLEGVSQKIREVANALGLEEKGKALEAELQKQVAQLKELQEDADPARVVFLMARGKGDFMAAGKNTAAQAMLDLAGAHNVIETYDGYKPVSAESLALLKPEVIVVGTRTLEAAGGVDGLLKIPALVITPAAREKRVVAMDELYLLGFGPRASQAALDLAKQLKN